MLLQHGLHGLQLQEVLAHVRVQDHLYAERAELPELVPRHVGEDVAVVLLDGPVSRGMNEIHMQSCIHVLIICFGLFRGWI